jgi:hypothetical protein
LDGLWKRLPHLIVSSCDAIMNKNTVIMDLPITIEELNTIVNAMSFGGNTALYEKLKLVKELSEQGLPYKKILREQYGIVA